MQKVQALQPEDQPLHLPFYRWFLQKHDEIPNIFCNVLASDEAMSTRTA